MQYVRNKRDQYKLTQLPKQQKQSCFFILFTKQRQSARAIKRSSKCETRNWSVPIAPVKSPQAPLERLHTFLFYLSFYVLKPVLTEIDWI